MKSSIKYLFSCALALTITAVTCGAQSLSRSQFDNSRRIEYFPVENVRITSGAFKTAQDKGIEYLLQLNPDRLLAPYFKEAGLTPKADNYTNWENTGLDGHIGGHYLSALSYMYAATKNPEIGQRLNYFISQLKSCADASGNGYLCGVPGGNAIWKDVAAGKISAGGFDLNGKWVPLYNIHKIYAGLKDAYIQTHNEVALELLVNLADWMIDEVSNLSDEQIQSILVSEHGGLNEIFADVALITGESKYLDLAHKFSHKQILEPLVAHNDELTGKHANTQIPKVIGFKRIADIECNRAWDSGVEFFWDDVVQHRSVSIGGNSVREHFHSPDDFSSMLTSEQGPETCNTYNMLRLSKMLHESSLDKKYADYEERALFNHILSSQNPVHGGFVYFTPMRSGHYRVYSQPQTSFWCCVGSGIENQARYGEYIYAHHGKDIYVNLFIPSELSWDGNTLSQITDFPNAESTSFIVNPSHKESFALNIRIPEWTSAADMAVTVNGKVFKPAVTDGYLSIKRKWKRGDKITVALPMHLSAEQLPDKSSNFSILYGPMVLAADLGADNQTGLFADDSRMGHVADGPRLPLDEMPMIVGDTATLLSHVTSVEGSPLTFTLSNVYPEKYEGLRLKPFSSLNECRYAIYFPVISEVELQDKVKKIAEQQAKEAELLSHTADFVICGEQQPESDHFIEMQNTWTGSAGDYHWRRAGRDGWFAYRMSPRDMTPDIVRIYYRPMSNCTASVYVDDKKIGNIPSGESNEITYIELPVSITADTPTVNVRVSADTDSTPEIYQVRLMKK